MRFFLSALLLLLAACSAGAPEETVENDPIVLEPGVSLQLAIERKARVSNILYSLWFDIPAFEDDPIDGEIDIRFDLSDGSEPLLLDFKEDPRKLKQLNVNGETTPIRHQNEHIILPSDLLSEGENEIEIEFEAGDTSLNRNPEYLYTLFVPDRARTAFPLFDQPNLKATYRLGLDVPAEWAAISNAPLESKEIVEDRAIYRFEDSDLISSYLFSFVAGAFEEITRNVHGREMTLLHRETDQDAVDRNVDAIFELHAESLEWLEAYTGIPYPFKKFDFAAIPAFQYGGMEHVGAIQYRAASLFLSESPSTPQLLSRASLIAHETAHMWFGDLVTMDWFNDVWTKEVYANFMAAKIVNPSFPEVDHDLSFLVRHYPSAYGVDRTAGANPIRQDLQNLNEAGTLYGAIIYNKAPIMMRQLELLLGEEDFQAGIQTYLQTYADGNATWPDLINIFDRFTETDVSAWSDIWVNSPGRPIHAVTGSPESPTLIQTDPGADGDRYWPQTFTINGPTTLTWGFDTQSVALDPQNRYFVNSDGLGYGVFPGRVPETAADWSTLTDLEKGVMLIDRYEEMLTGLGDHTPFNHLSFLKRHLPEEDNELLIRLMINQLATTFQQYTPALVQDALIEELEGLFTLGFKNLSKRPSTRRQFFFAALDVARSDELKADLLAIFFDPASVDGLTLSKRDISALGEALAVIIPERSADIITTLRDQLENPDEIRRLDFLTPVLQPDTEGHDKFFQSLKSERNRQTESWVLTGLRYLHHPSRTNDSKRYIAESLELLAEIQRTGDIFFPGRWLNASLSAHNSIDVANTVSRFLEDNPDYNYQLRLKILQAADPVFRAQRLLKTRSED